MAQNSRKLDQAMKGKHKATAVTRKSSPDMPNALDSERLTLSITSCSAPPASFRGASSPSPSRVYISSVVKGRPSIAVADSRGKLVTLNGRELLGQTLILEACQEDILCDGRHNEFVMNVTAKSPLRAKIAAHR